MVWVLWRDNYYETPIAQLYYWLQKLQNKVVRIINDMLLHDHITPH